jgi:hypothetical protein
MSSVDEFQKRFIWFEETAVAVKFGGIGGGVSSDIESIPLEANSHSKPKSSAHGCIVKNYSC